MSRGARIRAATAAAIVLSTCGLVSRSPSAQQAVAPSEAVIARLARIASDLCGDAVAEGPELVVVGPRMQWNGRFPPTLPSSVASSTAVVRQAEQSPELALARNGPWVVAYDSRERASVRLNCTSPNPDPRSYRVPVDRVAVSTTGDVAAHAPAGFTFIDPIESQSDSSGPRLPPSEIADTAGSPTQALVWLGRRLIAISAQKLTLVDPTPVGYGFSETLVKDAGQSVRLAFAYNGLLYVLNDDGCFDIYVGAALRPRLKRAACVEGPGLAYLAADRTTIRMFTAAATVALTAARPTAITARITGSGRDIASALTTLVGQQWLLPVPVRLDRATSSPSPAVEAGREISAGWPERFRRDWWPSGADFDQFTRAVVEKGWSGLQASGEWSEGPGIALRWLPAVEFIKPAGRSLAAIGAEYGGLYGDDVERLLAMNSSLGQTLEGALFQQSWIPVGAVAGSSTTRPLAFTAVQVPEPAPESKGPGNPLSALGEPFRRLGEVLQRTGAPQACDVAAPAPDEKVSALVGRGVPLLGRLEDALAAALGQPTAVDLQADSAIAVGCASRTDRRQSRAASDIGGRVLLLRNVKLRARHGRTMARLSEAVNGENGIRYRPNNDAAWPIVVDGDVMIAAGGAPGDDATRRQYLGKWLDKVFTDKELEPQLFPMTALEVTVVASQFWPAQSRPIPHVTVLSAEVDAARPREGEACTSLDTARAQRDRYDVLVGLVPARHSERIVDKIGVAENAVALLHDIFRKDGATVWLALNRDTNQFQPVVEASTSMTPTPEFVRHGTAVAGLIVAQKDLPGELADGRLIWIDVTKNPDVTLLNLLSGNFSVVNVSQRLGENWATNDIEDKVSEGWNQRLLFVAAAPNVGESTNGPPLSWKLRARVNVLGVGLAQKNGSLPSTPRYRRDYVDLLAPGLEVPAITQTGAIECHNGTSFATAYVSAIAALVGHRIGLRAGADQVRARLLATAEWDDAYGSAVKGGLINARRAVEMLGQNVLVAETAGGHLELNVSLKDAGALRVAGGFEYVTGAPGGRSERTPAVPWSHVLRLERRVHRDDPPPGTPENLFRLAYVNPEGKFVVLHDVAIDERTAAIPIARCTDRLAPGRAVRCEGMSVNAVIDYIADVPSITITDF